MTAVTRPRGPLPPRVYWTRRLVVVALALGLVYAVAHLLGAGGGPAGPSARPVAADGSSSAPSATGPTTTRTTTPTRSAKASASGTPTASDAPLAVPDGPCRSKDIVAAPAALAPSYAGARVTLTVALTTTVSPACTWEVSSDSLVVKVAAGDERIWTSQDCDGAIPKQSVVVRRDTPVTVAVAWSGRRSDEDCSSAGDWAKDGSYEVVAAALGGNPTQGQFELALQPTRTRTATPTVTPSSSATTSPAAEASESGR